MEKYHVDNYYIEFAAKKFFEMCLKHPEICPHEYMWTRTENTKENKIKKHYVCTLCQTEKCEIVEEK